MRSRIHIDPASAQAMDHSTSPGIGSNEGRAYPQYWLIVERLENWERDRADGFRVLGFCDSHKRIVESFRPGDILIVYVARARSALADCRRVTSERPVRSFDRRWSDDLYPLRITTEPVLTLPIDRWVRIADLAPVLAMTRGKSDWRQIVRQALRRIDPHDAETMMAAITRAAAP